MGDEMRAPGLVDAALTSYLSGAEDANEWALIDNLDADEARDLAKLAITMLREANGIIALASVACDGMTPRAVRFAARDIFATFADPYLDALAKRLGRS